MADSFETHTSSLLITSLRLFILIVSGWSSSEPSERFYRLMSEGVRGQWFDKERTTDDLVVCLAFPLALAERRAEPLARGRIFFLLFPFSSYDKRCQKLCS